MTKSQTNLPKIDVLTSLRFFAAFVIVLYHAQDNFNCLNNLPDIVFSQGVTFFFILSGFILTYVYPQLSSFKEASYYFIKRLARIWPLHLTILFGSLFFLPKGLLSVGSEGSQGLIFFANLLMVQSWIPNLEFFFSINSPSWSISTEMFFYLAFPLLLLLAKRSTWLPLVLGVVLTSFMITFTNQLNVPDFSTNSVSVQGLIAINPLTRLLEFIAGMTIAFIFRRIQDREFNQLSFLPGSALEAFALVLCLSSILLTKPIVESLNKIPFVSNAGEYWLSESGIALLPFSLLIFVFALRRGLVSRLLQNRLLVYLGEISFAVYLCHYPLLKYCAFYMPQQRSTASFLLFLAILLMISHLLYKLIEMPSRSHLTTLYKNLTTSQTEKPLISNIKLPGSVNFKLLAITVSEITLLVGLFALITPKLDIISSDNEIVNQHGSEIKAKDVLVADRFKIHTLSTNLSNKTMNIEIVISSKSKQTVNHFVSYQMLDRDGKELSFIRSRIAPHNSKVDKGDCWRTNLEIPLNEADKVSNLGIIIAEDQFLNFTGARSDMNGKRLLIPLEKSISKSTNRIEFN